MWYSIEPWKYIIQYKAAFFFLFKVYFFSNIAFKGFIYNVSKYWNNYDFGPSELGARLIDEASWRLIYVLQRKGRCLVHCKNDTLEWWSFLSAHKKRALNNIGKSFFIVWQSCTHSHCKCITNHWEMLQCILKHSTVLNDA